MKNWGSCPLSATHWLSGKQPKSFSLRSEACFVMLLISLQTLSFLYRAKVAKKYHKTKKQDAFFSSAAKPSPKVAAPPS
jgi:hypothetical protein